MPVEIFARTAQILGFSQNTRVYDDFPNSQPEFMRKQTEGSVSTVQLLAVDRALDHQGEK
jgi:hypothetical protein